MKDHRFLLMTGKGRKKNTKTWLGPDSVCHSGRCSVSYPPGTTDVGEMWRRRTGFMRNIRRVGRPGDRVRTDGAAKQRTGGGQERECALLPSHSRQMGVSWRRSPGEAE